MSLTPQNVATLNAAADRIVPPDDGTPSAVASGAAAQLVALLDGDLAPIQQEYALFLTQIDIESQVAFGTPFAQLNTEKQDLLLNSFQASAFFRVFVEHVQEQFWTTSAGAKLIGFAQN